MKTYANKEKLGETYRRKYCGVSESVSEGRSDFYVTLQYIMHLIILATFSKYPLFLAFRGILFF